MILEDKFHIAAEFIVRYGVSAASSILSERSPVVATSSYLESCADFITTSVKTLLPKFAVEASLYYVRIACLLAKCDLVK